jgi:hypothetical protein
MNFECCFIVPDVFPGGLKASLGARPFTLWSSKLSSGSGIWIRIRHLNPDSLESSDKDSVNPDPQYRYYFSETLVQL